jgi:hypothetical protein
MRNFLLILILTFSFQTLIKADDISDFEIEGMSIGDSLLDFYSHDEIKSLTELSGSYYKDNKFLVMILKNKYENYDEVEVTIIPNDKLFVIQSLDGVINFENNYEGCKKEKIDIVDEIKNLYKDAYSYNAESQHSAYPNSVIDENVFYPKYGGYVRISCTNWSTKMEKQKKWKDGLDVTIGSDKFKKFLQNEAY